MAKWKEQQEEMTLEEAKAARAAKHKASPPILADHQKRESFRVYWAQERNKFGKPKNLEEVLWIHLKATKQDSPEQFEAGLKHFGLKKVK
jgi:hypothetical protein